MSGDTIIGLDLAKRVFRLHGARADGAVVFRKKLTRAQLLSFLSDSLAVSWPWRPAPRLMAGGAAAEQAPAPAAGSEAMVTAADPQSVLAAVQAYGHTATLGVDNVGDPMVTSDIEGTPYFIFFYGCVENTDCKYLQFSGGFDLPNGWTLEAANEWNKGKILTSAYLSPEMDPYLHFFVTTTGGMNQANFADAIDWWQAMLMEFKKVVGA